MSKGTTPHTIRIEDKLWESARTKAAAEDRTVSEVTRQLLTEWIEK
ncbi:hypothetical protein [Pseudarthrobacter sp. PS3-L1]|nr:hypothetical protein [Pseudarthrobacter sp. PS3-L1]MDJ0321651.1 hypothetical protein [Pseudarthrobacter sp. PS3-L1]